MAEVGGKPLIHHLLTAIEEARFDEVILVVGHGADALMRSVASVSSARLPIRYVSNREYATTNNIYSLYLAFDALGRSSWSEIAIFESDVFVAADAAIPYLTEQRAMNTVLASPYEYWMEGTCVTIDSGNRIDSFVAKSDVQRFSYGELFKTVNWYRFSQCYVREIYIPFLKAYLRVKGKTGYYEDVLKVINPHVNRDLTAYIIPPSTWMEIDDEEDLRRAEIVASGEDRGKAALLSSQYGGYWKHHGITDLTLLENPCFPSAGMLAELGRCVDQVIRGYPSKQAIIAKIAAKTLKVEARNLVVGNGASELLSALASIDKRSYAIVPPFFLEYERLLSVNRLRILEHEFPRDALEDAYRRWLRSPEHDLIVVNPNNPTGELVDAAFLAGLLDRGAAENRRVVIDESFIDFACDPSASFLAQEPIDKYPNLVIVKSLGKSHGVAGIRLGLLATSDAALLDLLREKLPIWNVSSIAEAYLDLLPKYIDDLELALKTVNQERQELFSHVRSLGVFAGNSSANFLLLPVKPGMGMRVQEAFFRERFLIKLVKRTGLHGEWLRLPIKDPHTNKIVLDLLSRNKSSFMSAAEIHGNSRVSAN